MSEANEDSIEPTQTGPYNQDLLDQSNPIDDPDQYKEDSDDIIETVTKSKLLTQAEKDKFLTSHK